MDFSRIETMFCDNNKSAVAEISSDAKVTSACADTFPLQESPTIGQNTRTDQLLRDDVTNQSSDANVFPETTETKRSFEASLYPETTETNRSFDASLYPETAKANRSFDGSVYPETSEQNYGKLDKESAEERVGCVSIFGTPIVSLFVEGNERLCLAQISNTILRHYSYNEIHNRRVALGITCVQCSPSQLEVLRRAGAMPMSSRRCGLITRRESERLVKSFIEEVPPPRLPEDFSFKVVHACGWGSKGLFYPSRYNSSRAKCIKCVFCEAFFSPNKFIFHYHKLAGSSYQHPDAANFNSWRRHLNLEDSSCSESLMHTWEDVKAMFNGGCRKRFSTEAGGTQYTHQPVIEAEKTRACLSYGHTIQQTSPKYLPFSPSAGRTHPAFPNRLFGHITSYGDFLRTLSLPYNMWTVGNPSSVACNPTEPMTFNNFQGQNCLPLNTSAPVPRIEWSQSRRLPPSGQMGIEDNMIEYRQRCLDNKRAELNTVMPRTDACTSKWREVKAQPRDRSSRRDEDVQTYNAAKNHLEVSTVPNKEIKEIKKKLECKDKESEKSKSKEKTMVENKDGDETCFLNALSSMSAEKLREAIEEEKMKKAEVDKEYKRIKNMLRLRALKELELREEYARQLSSIKENIWIEIEEEREAKTRVENELKETQQLLQRLSQQMQVTS